MNSDIPSIPVEGPWLTSGISIAMRAIDMIRLRRFFQRAEHFFWRYCDSEQNDARQIGTFFCLTRKGIADHETNCLKDKQPAAALKSFVKPMKPSFAPNPGLQTGQGSVVDPGSDST